MGNETALATVRSPSLPFLPSFLQFIFNHKLEERERGKVSDCNSQFISSTLKMEATRSSETSVYNKPTQRHIPEDGILHSHLRENLKSHLF
jgi:hypothetical protein